MSSFVINTRGRLVFPSDVYPVPDFTSIDTLDELREIIRRDYEIKAPTGDDLVRRTRAGLYSTKYELLRDLAIHLFWVERYTVTMYEKRPTRWRDVPLNRDDVFLPVVAPWVDAPRKASTVEMAYRRLPAAWSDDVEDALFDMLFDIFGHRRHRASELPPVPATAGEALTDPGQLTLMLERYDPDYPHFSHEEIVDCGEDIPELETVRRWALTLHNQHPWDRTAVRLCPLEELEDDDVVVVLHPRSPEVTELIHRLRARATPRPEPPAPTPPRPPARPLPPVMIHRQFDLQPRIEGLAVRRGEVVCTNDDIVRNAATSWSPMTAADISRKTGIETRRYTRRSVEHLALDAATAALAHARRAPEDIGAVVFCTCTSTRLLPSAAAWLSGQLGMLQTHASVDLVAACAGFSYGLLEAIRLVQEVRRPVLLVCADKFSDKIGRVRTSRMLFGDGASSLVIGPGEAGQPGDMDLVQTYASGPASEVCSIVWPNVEFGRGLTVYGPEVKALVKRYLGQMMDELSDLPAEDGRSMLDAIELIVPHQANQRMVTELAASIGIPDSRLYFNIAQVGNTSAASIPLAIHDAVIEGVIERPTRLFTPGFGAGAVAGYAVLRLDPGVVAVEPSEHDTFDATKRMRDTAVATAAVEAA